MFCCFATFIFDSVHVPHALIQSYRWMALIQAAIGMTVGPSTWIVSVGICLLGVDVTTRLASLHLLPFEAVTTTTTTTPQPVWLEETVRPRPAPSPEPAVARPRRRRRRARPEAPAACPTAAAGSWVKTLAFLWLVSLCASAIAGWRARGRARVEPVQDTLGEVGAEIRIEQIALDGVGSQESHSDSDRIRSELMARAGRVASHRREFVLTAGRRR